MKITKEIFGCIDGVDVDLFTLINDHGMLLKITNYGARITSICTPDKKGVLGDVVTGFDNLASYVNGCPYFGCVVGRYGNRIAKGSFDLKGVTYQLAVNNGENHLHGGLLGFDKVLWNSKVIEEKHGARVELSYVSQAGEEGYPGNLDVKVTYTLNNDNEVKIDYWATTDQTTVCNLTNHTYFNLKDAGKSSVLDHEVMIDAHEYLPIDATSIPIGEAQSVLGTPFDFTKLKKVGESIDLDNEQLKNGAGYDHNFILNGSNGQVRQIATVSEPTSGRVMKVYTDQPGVQFYSGNFLDGSLTGKEGAVYQKRNALCLETQHYPDSPNQSKFPSTTLNPGDTYQSSTIYRFE